MTLGEKSIIAAVLNALKNNDLISQHALNETFKKLELPIEYQGVWEQDIFNFLIEPVYNAEISKKINDNKAME